MDIIAMTTGMETQIDWNSLEKQFRDGRMNGGNHGGDGDDGDGWRPERPDNHDWSNGTAFGLFGGLFAGLLVGTIATGEADSIMVKNYEKQHGIVTVPSNKDAVYWNVYDKHISGNGTEITAFAAPILVLAALGVVVGQRIERRLKNR